MINRMTKWELAQIMGLRVFKDELTPKGYIATADISTCNEKEVNYFDAESLEEAQKLAAQTYFWGINYDCFRS